MHPRIKLVVALLCAPLLLAACSGSSSSAPKASRTAQAGAGGACQYRFALITHGDNGNFWSVVYKGAKNAAKDLGCTLSEVYGSQQQGQAEPDDSAENAQIQDAVNAHVNGIAQGLGVGSTCSTKAAPAHGPACTELILSTPKAASNPQQAIGQVSAYLQAHTGVNAVMTLNSAIGTALVTAKPGSVKIGTFDLDSQVVSDLKSSSMDFAIDQQQYLQGSLPIVTLYLYNKHEGNSVGPGSVVPTGPLVVNKGNVATVQAAISAGDD